MSSVATEPIRTNGARRGAEALPAASCPITATTLRAEVADPLLAEAQRRWAARPLVERLHVIRKARHWMAAHGQMFAEAISPELQRTNADTLATELLPVLDAMRFLERYAGKVLAPRRLGPRGRPLWLSGVQSEVHRAPFGHVLVIGPANYPLFIAGVQTAQALVAGNAVTWKPGAGGERVALLMAHALREAGLPRGVLCVTDEGMEAAQTALAQVPDKVVFTGSYESGRKVLRALAETATPAVMELSGADAVVVLPSADLAVAVKAIGFGLRLNGAEVCMSPRRLIATAETMRALRPLLVQELAKIAPVRLNARAAATLQALTENAVAQGASVIGEVAPAAQRPLVIDKASQEMAIAASDVFAPVISLIEAPSVLHMPEIVNACSYALTAAIFGDEREARSVGEQLRVGTVLVNDLIAPTVDPRVPFGGRGHSGFGVTRGSEGLLEMTAAKTILVRRKGVTLHYDAVGSQENSLFAAVIGALHAGSVRERFLALRNLMRAARRR